MTDSDLVGIFKYGLTRLHVDDAGLTDDNDLHDMDTVAILCKAIKTMAGERDTLRQLHLHRLACLTEDLLVSPWVPSPGIAREWLRARSELLQVEIPRG